MCVFIYLFKKITHCITLQDILKTITSPILWISSKFKKTFMNHQMSGFNSTT
ncbi:hypothetical protein BDF14DRAFT_1806928, partial [Spinellus fusiger]